MMLKHKDFRIFFVLLIISFIGSYHLYDDSFENYSDIITFLSIIVGFQITSLSILFNTPLKKVLYDRKIKHYETELHRLRDFYKSSLFFGAIAIVILLLYPEDFKFYLPLINKEIGKYIFILPAIIGDIYFFYKLLSDLLQIFVYPTND